MKTKKYTLLLILFFFASTLAAQTHIWNGNGGDINWSNAANWDVGTVPDATSEVLIPDGFDVEIRSNTVAVNAIELEGTGHLTLANTINLGSEIFISTLSEFTFEEGLISGGIIENSGTITLIGIGAARTFNSVTINNAGLFLIIESNQTIVLDTTINNLSAGIIDIPSNGGLVHQNTSSTLNNAGILKKSQGSTQNGNYYLILTINNTGTFEVIENQAVLLLASQYEFNNLDEGIMIGGGVFDITAMFTNSGTVYPGQIGEAGSMDVTNNFSLNDGTISLDLAGTQTGEYDIVIVTGGAAMEGDLVINLLFAPEIDDEFVVVTSLFNMATCIFPQETTANFDGISYTFDILCDTNDVTLRVAEMEVLGIDDITLNESEFYVQPNPVGDDATFVFSWETLELGSQIGTVKLYNVLGQEVYTIRNFSETNNTFIRGNLNSGLYFAHLIADGKILASTKVLLN